MEIEKLLKFGIDYLSDYFGVLFSTIRSPKLAFPPQLPTDNPSADAQDNAPLIITRLNPKLLSFLLISVFIGSIFNTNIPGRSKPPDYVVTAVMVIGYWLLFSVLTHVICKAFGSPASFIQTLSINLQVLAVIHVLSSFAAFLWGVAVIGAGSGNAAFYLRRVVGGTFIEAPVYAYFVVQFVLVLVYMPLANKRVNGFSFLRLRRAVHSRVLSAALAWAENALFFIVFIALSVMLVKLSMTNYHVHKVPLSQPEISAEIRNDLPSVDTSRNVNSMPPTRSSPSFFQGERHARSNIPEGRAALLQETNESGLLEQIGSSPLDVVSGMEQNLSPKKPEDLQESAKQVHQVDNGPRIEPRVGASREPSFARCAGGYSVSCKAVRCQCVDNVGCAGYNALGNIVEESPCPSSF